MGNILISVEL